MDIKKYKKETITKRMREDVWKRYCGDLDQSSPCLCCQKHKIDVWNFHCGHVVAESKGGETNADNLRPICSQCNLSMKTMDMQAFMKKHQYTEPPNWSGFKKSWLQTFMCS